MKMLIIEGTEAPFDMDKFNEENPIYDPFVDRINEREKTEPLACWGCLGLYDRATGERIGDADPEGEDVSSLHELCHNCLTVMKERPLQYEL